MTTHRNQFQVIFISVTISLLIGVNPALCDNYITYRLLPGSTFTPMFGSQIIGPAEALTGSFQWHDIGPSVGFNGESFKTTSLHFESDSCIINLSTSTNIYVNGVRDNSNKVSFDVVVDITDLSNPASAAHLGGFFGTYSGPMTSPTYLSIPYTEVYLLHGVGSNRCACLTLYAAPIPEPATFLILGFGAFALRRKR